MGRMAYNLSSHKTRTRASANTHSGAHNAQHMCGREEDVVDDVDDDVNKSSGRIIRVVRPNARREFTQIM